VRGLTTTILLLVVLAGLGGYIFFVENKKPATGADAKPKAFTVEADQIEELHIAVADGDSTRARRTDKTWKLVEPVEADGDNSELTNMASSLAALDIQRVVDENPTDLAQYGLSPARIEIGFKAKGQKDETRLLVGDKTPTGGDVYAQKPGEKRVFLVSSAIDDTFHRTAFDLRDKTILKFDRDKVDGLEITHNGMTYQLARKAADWMIVKPVSMRADYAAVEGLITSLSATLMQKFVAPDATAAQLHTYGLDKPSASASVLMGNDKATLILGKTENAETYARDAARPMVVMVAPTIVSDLNKPLDDFRRHDLFDVRSFSAKRVELKRGAESFAFDRTTVNDKDVWKNAAGKEVDTTKVEDLLTKISNLRIQSFEQRADPALKTPALTVTAQFGQSKGENRTETVTLARSGATTVASRPDEPGTLKIEGNGLDEVMKALDSPK
jgi:hypothetical protein